MKATFSTWDPEICCTCVENIRHEGHQLLCVSSSVMGVEHLGGYAVGSSCCICTGTGSKDSFCSVPRVPLCCTCPKRGWLDSVLYILLCTQKNAQINAILFKTARRQVWPKIQQCGGAIGKANKSLSLVEYHLKYRSANYELLVKLHPAVL